MGYFAGIDLGTSSVKVLVMNENGEKTSVGHASYEISIPEMSYAEQSPDEWWKATKTALAEAVLKSGIRACEIDSVGFSGQMHGLVALGKDLNPIYPAVIWMDQRAVDETEIIRSIAGELLETELLNRPGAGMMTTTLLWLKNHKREIYEKIYKVMLPKDYIRFKLTSEIGTDHSDACGTLAYSVRNRRWCTELLDRLDINKDIFPDIHESFEQAGVVSAQAAEETGLSYRTKVMYGAGDSASQLTGNAVIREGIIACNIGTASQIAAVSQKPVYDKEMRLQTWCHEIPDTWYVQGGTLNGGSTLSWLKKKILKDSRDYSELDDEAYRTAAGSEGIIFIPYLAGERTPFMNPHAKGVYFGLGMKHERSHIIKATMEGVIYNLKLCIDILNEMGINGERLISSGGAAKGNTWRRIQADVFDMPVYTTNSEEEACLGAAVAAAVGSGVYRDATEALNTLVKLNPDPIEPIQVNTKIYREEIERFKELYTKINSLYTR